MIKFCECGSIVKGDFCTNKNCSMGREDNSVTFKQMEFITELQKSHDFDSIDYDFKTMTKREASRIIDELLSRF